MDDYADVNRKNWDERASVHPDTDYYDIEGFLDGDSSLYSLEREELADVVDADTELLHLMCHFGLDTLSWARECREVVGVDFSGDAIALARDLAVESGIENASFEHGNVLDVDLDREFDVVFNTFGVLSWLPDLDGWADTVVRHLRDGGVFYLADVHPFASVFAGVEADTATFDTEWSYFPTGEGVRFDVQGSYADTSAEFEHTEQYQFPHSLGEAVTALSGAGLCVEFLHEHRWADFPMFDTLEEDDWGRWWLPEDVGVEVPLTFSLRARAV